MRNARGQYIKDSDAIKDSDRCRRCGIPLMTNAEAKIGVHIACVQEVLIRQRRTSIPKPSYRGSKI